MPKKTYAVSLNSKNIQEQNVMDYLEGEESVSAFIKEALIIYVGLLEGIYTIDKHGVKVDASP
jgi:hypothetical protein